VEQGAVATFSIFAVGDKEADDYKWYRSQEAGRDLGEPALRDWVRKHWNGFYRTRWLEHLEGKRFWLELESGDFGLLKKRFQDHEEQAMLLDRILDRLKVMQENLNIIWWAQEWGLNSAAVRHILEIIDINSRRMAHRFDA